MMVRYSYLAIAACLALVAGCAQSSSSTSPTTAPAAALPQPTANPDDLALVPQWRLVELNGQPLVGNAAQAPPTIVFDVKAHRVSGFAGVNRFSGGFAVRGNALTFGPMAGTRMAGPQDAMDLEDAYYKALGRTTAWRISGDRLDLLAGSMTVARFRK